MELGVLIERQLSQLIEARYGMKVYPIDT